MYECTTKEFIYGFFTYSKPTEKGEKGSICINTLRQKKETSKSFGYETNSYWIDFSDEAFKLIKANILTKPVEFRLLLVPDYKESNRFTAQVLSINEFVIKQ